VPQVGDRVNGKYELLRRIGAGGMGDVFEAVHGAIGKRVAIKCLHPELTKDATILARFRREAEAAAAVGHRGIVEVFDVGTSEDGAPYLVMEMLQGHSLGALLDARGRLEVAEAAYVVCQALSALSAAHEAGIVHRDLKPDNIFVVDTGTPLAAVKLLDFGISRIIGGQGVESVTRVTEAGAAIGTPAYMSPEQCRGELDIDHRTDLYAMGVVLYRCVTGVSPFEAPNYNALMQRIISAPPTAPRAVRPEVPEGLERAILRAMAKDRAERQADAATMLAEVLPFVDERAAIAIPAPRPRVSHALPLGTAEEGKEAGVAPQPGAEAAVDAPPSGLETTVPSRPAGRAEPAGREGTGSPPQIPPTRIVAPEPRGGAAARRRGAIRWRVAVVLLLASLVAGLGALALRARRSDRDPADSGPRGEPVVVAPPNTGGQTLARPGDGGLIAPGPEGRDAGATGAPGAGRPASVGGRTAETGAPSGASGAVGIVPAARRGPGKAPGGRASSGEPDSAPSAVSAPSPPNKELEYGTEIVEDRRRVYGREVE